MEYFFGELIGNLLAGMSLSRRNRHATARDKVLHALRLSRLGRLTPERHEFAQRWLTIGARHIDLFRLTRHQEHIQAALARIQVSAANPARG